MRSVSEMASKEMVLLMVRQFWSEKLLPVINDEINGCAEKILKLNDESKAGTVKGEATKQYELQVKYYSSLKLLRELALEVIRTGE